MKLIVTVQFGCTTAKDDGGTEYNIDAVITGSPSKSVAKTKSGTLEIKEGDRFEAIKLSTYTIQLKNKHETRPNKI